jgi:membrane protease YdiL (CAAX protease family)
MLNHQASVFIAGVFLFIVIGTVLFFFRGKGILKILDAAGLYLPLVHALGCVFWFLAGCFQGKYVSMKTYGLYLRFINPTPLYTIIADILIFFYLRRLFWISRKGGRFQGVVFASYLIIHAAVRISLNVFERESPVFFKLTSTQVVMGVFILVALFLFWVVFYLNPVLKSNLPPADPEPGDIDYLRRLLSAAGLVVFYLVVIFLIYYVTRKLMVWKWPIQPVESLTDAYGRILFYMPVMSVPAIALGWLKKNGEPIQPWFQWGRFSILFLIGLLASTYYSLELLVFKHPVLRGAEFWPPAIIISIMNAFSEEIMYRLALYRMVINANFSKWTALVTQSVMYSLIHFMVIGGVLGLFSLVYGFLLGLIVQRNKSLSQAIVCHLIIDIGCIGMPMLRA